MTQLDGKRVFDFKTGPASNCIHHAPEYYVREPLGKRAADSNAFADMVNGAPRAKKRFDKINTRLQQFSISNETVPTVNIESSSDEEMLEDDELPSCSENVVIEEPEEISHIKLDDKIHAYLERSKKYTDLLLPKLEQIKGDELMIWRPKRPSDPFEDPSMSGRITEIDDEEELAEEVDDVAVAFPDDTSSEMSSNSSPRSSSPHIVELTDSSVSSPHSYAEQDDYSMDTD